MDNTGGADKVLTTGGNNTSTSFSGLITDSGANTLGITKEGSGTLTLSGTNTFSGIMEINAGTIVAANPSALGYHTVIHNNAILTIGTTLLDVGAYQQNTGATLNLTANSATDYGRIITGLINTSFVADSTVNVTVGGRIPNNTVLTIATGDTGLPDHINSSSPFVSFLASYLGGSFVLTATSSSTTFASVATNPNATAVGNVLDNITNPSSDMTTVLDALFASTSDQVAASLNTMSPIEDNSIFQSAISMMNQVIDTMTIHFDNTRAFGSDSGISTGDDYFKRLGVWAQGIGDYAHQDARGYSNGYNATSWGVSGGVDIPFCNDSIRMGIGSGYGQTFVRSKDNSGKTDIDSIPGTVYCTYDNDRYPFYLDTAFTFMYNTYNGSRQVSAGTTIQRTANSDYGGQQYSGYFEGGYSLFYKKIRFTPLASVNYMHLHTDSYTETGADSLNLSVKPQDYDMCLTGIGAKIAYPLILKSLNILPDFHAKWLYDWVGDKQAIASSFAGGGTAFGTNSFTPARSGYDLGTRVAIATKNNISLDLGYDLLLKSDYYEHYGSVTLKYSF
ncbi:MAG: autotransporter domain-containing protein [Candidatus Omnitrophica bacterium]|nr:autotransporter domain-containing protein [Candidatus Omnitrophota bacterium]